MLSSSSDEGDAAVRVARRRAHFELAVAERDPVAVREVAIGALGAAVGADRDRAAELAA